MGTEYLQFNNEQLLNLYRLLKILFISIIWCTQQ